MSRSLSGRPVECRPIVAATWRRDISAQVRSVDTKDAQDIYICGSCEQKPYSNASQEAKFLVTALGNQGSLVILTATSLWGPIPLGAIVNAFAARARVRNNTDK